MLSSKTFNPGKDLASLFGDLARNSCCEGCDPLPDPTISTSAEYDSDCHWYCKCNAFPRAAVEDTAHLSAVVGAQMRSIQLLEIAKSKDNPSLMLRTIFQGSA
jgi:hypothetical protein